MKTIQTSFISACICILFCLTTGQNASSQDYNTGIGVRLGGLTSGITVKSFVNPNSALEGVLSFGRQTFVITGLYEKHNPISGAPGLQWLYGGGAHLGFFNYGGRYHYWVYNYRGDRVYVAERGRTAAVGGLDFIIGLDYKFNGAPLNVGLDVKPFIDIFDGTWLYFDGALSFRFVF